ncbi:DUF2029 domain-containing protein [Baekduia soli]|uniref:DUF2029 domain-containing protein n=1 Tax=Baekduia soli TaxID=496014 RepID=A0A5B8UAW4_9ACTN|nr:glycosyltransferase 87 family protein [Baekduia soli]QEC50349.1 DUF2029 domain-containing protein [Baekduia soli]
MAAHGLNPYTHLPVQGPHDVAYQLANWHHLPTPYGPLFTLLSEPLSLLGLPTAYWAWKLVVLASALGLLALVWWLARRLGRSPQRALVCAGLCPVTLGIGIGGLHNDTPAMLCIVGAAACAVRSRERAPSGTPRAARTPAAAGTPPPVCSPSPPPASSRPSRSWCRSSCSAAATGCGRRPGRRGPGRSWPASSCSSSAVRCRPSASRAGS